MYNLASTGANAAGNQIVESGGGSGLSSADWINLGSQALQSSLSSMNARPPGGSKETRRRTRAEHLLNLLRDRLKSEEETRHSQNSMANTINEILQNKAAHFRTSLL